VRAIAAAGATSVTPLALHLRPGAREWFMSWLGRHHPHLVRRYERLYADGAYAPKWYQRRITRQVHDLAREYGIGPARADMPRRGREPGAEADPPSAPRQEQEHGRGHGPGHGSPHGATGPGAQSGPEPGSDPVPESRAPVTDPVQLTLL
jgi:hypothetical protein